MIFTDMSCSLELNTFNKYVVIAASVAGLSGVAATAYFYRRKQKRHSSKFQHDEDVSERSCSRTKQKRRKIHSRNYFLEHPTMPCIKNTKAVKHTVTKTKGTVVPSSASQMLDENKQSFNKLKHTMDFKLSSDLTQTVKSELPVKVKHAQKYNLKMYEKALGLVAKGEVKCRKIRTEMTFVRSKQDFLAKVHCLRQAFEVMLRDEDVRSCLADTFGSIADTILNTTNNTEYFQRVEFNEAYMDVFIFLFIGNRNNIMEDIRCQGISHYSFYDIVLCFILMDVFEDIEDLSKTIAFPEKSVHLSESLKVNPIICAFEDVYRERQQHAYDVNGLLVRLYRVCSYLAPALAIGLRGPTSYLQKACLSFQKETKDYVECLFDFDQVRYTTPTEMAEDLWGLTRERLTRLNETVNLIEKSKQVDDAEN